MHVPHVRTVELTLTGLDGQDLLEWVEGGVAGHLEEVVRWRGRSHAAQLAIIDGLPDTDGEEVDVLLLGTWSLDQRPQHVAGLAVGDDDAHLRNALPASSLSEAASGQGLEVKVAKRKDYGNDSATRSS